MFSHCEMPSITKKPMKNGSAGKAGTQAQTPSSVSGSGSGAGSKRSYGNPLQQVLERSGIKMKTTNLMN